MRSFPGVNPPPREWFVRALVGVVVAASLLPCRGAGARAFDALAVFAIASLFFLQGARLSRDAVAAGMKNWRLHLGITSTTFVLFPLLIMPSPLEASGAPLCCSPVDPEDDERDQAPTIRATCRTEGCKYLEWTRAPRSR